MKRTLKILGLSFLTIIIAISSILGIIYWVYDVPMANVDGGGTSLEMIALTDTVGGRL